MKIRKVFLAIILLSLSFCFVVSGAGYGEIPEWMIEAEVYYIDYELLNARVNYIIRNPLIFQGVMFFYDSTGAQGSNLPQSVDTKEKIYILVTDNRNEFYGVSGISLLDRFKQHLEVLYAYIDGLATDINTDIVAQLCSRQGITLAYFHQGEYYLWNE